MAWLFADDENRQGRQPYGILRYRQVLERDWKKFFLVDLVTLGLFLPFGLGVAYAVLSSSILVLIPACVLGGCFVGPGLSGMVDCILRSLRDCKDDLWVSYRRAWKQNFRSSIVPGIVFCLFLGFEIFMGMLLYWSDAPVTAGTLAIYFFSMVLAMMVFSVYWPQLVLFDQSAGVRLKNCLLFCITYFWRTLGAATLQVVWWLLGVLLVPWSAYLVPIFGVWVILFVSQFLLYDKLNRAFHIEEQIEESFPEQLMD